MAAYSYNGTFSSLLRNYNPYPHAQKDAQPGGPATAGPKKQDVKKGVQSRPAKIQGWTFPKDDSRGDEDFGEWFTSAKENREPEAHSAGSYQRGGSKVATCPIGSRCSAVSAEFERESLNEAYVVKPPTPRPAPRAAVTRANTNLSKNAVATGDTRSAPAALLSRPGLTNMETAAVSTPFEKVSNNSSVRPGAAGGPGRPGRMTRSNSNLKPNLFKITASVVSSDKLAAVDAATVAVGNGSGGVGGGSQGAAGSANGTSTGSGPRRARVGSPSATVSNPALTSLADPRPDTVLRAPLSRTSCHSSMTMAPMVGEDGLRRAVPLQPPIDELDSDRIPEIIPKEIVLKSRTEQINYIHSRITALESELTRGHLLPASIANASSVANESRSAISSFRPNGNNASGGNRSNPAAVPSNNGASSAPSVHRQVATPSSIRQATTKLLTYNRKYCLGSFPASKYGYKGGDSTSEEAPGVDISAFSKPVTPPRLKMAKKDKVERQSARAFVPSKITIQEAIPDIGMTWKFGQFPDTSGPDAALAAKMKLF